MTREKLLRYGKEYLCDLETACCKIGELHLNFVRESIKALEREQCEDAISRQAVIDIVSHECDEWKGLAKEIVKQFNELPSVQPKYNTSEWCHDCSEYDHDKHCCPRYNKVIRNAVEEIKQPKTHWISYWDEEARCYVYKCPECGNKQPFDTKCCWECGTRLIEPQEKGDKE